MDNNTNTSNNSIVATKSSQLYNDFITEETTIDFTKFKQLCGLYKKKLNLFQLRKWWVSILNNESHNFIPVKVWVDFRNKQFPGSKCSPKEKFLIPKTKEEIRLEEEKKRLEKEKKNKPRKSKKVLRKDTSWIQHPTFGVVTPVTYQKRVNIIQQDQKIEKSFNVDKLTIPKRIHVNNITHKLEKSLILKKIDELELLKLKNKDLTEKIDNELKTIKDRETLNNTKSNNIKINSNTKQIKIDKEKNKKQFKSYKNNNYYLGIKPIALPGLVKENSQPPKHYLSQPIENVIENNETVLNKIKMIPLVGLVKSGSNTPFPELKKSMANK